MNTSTKAILAATAAAVTLASASKALAQYVVQIPVDSVLNGRSVSTFTGNVVVPYTPNQGVYSNGASGYATAAVQMQLAKTSTGVGLPDDGLFPATGMLPPFQLHFSNAAPATSQQTVCVYHATAPQSFQFPVPPAIYSAMYLIFTSGEGTSNATITLSYSGGVPNDVSTWMLPDTGAGIQAGGSPHFYLTTNTGKWLGTTDSEPTNHTIEGIQLTPSSKGMLTGIQVAKTNAGYLVFWGATGIATTPVDAGTALGFDSGLGGGADSGGSPLDASTGSANVGTTDATTSSGTSSSGTATNGDASAGTASSGAESDATAGSAAAGAIGSGATGSSSGSGCSLAPTTGTDACWISLAALAWLAGAGRRPSRKSVAANRRSAC
jgi:hypothetical protein